MELLLGSVRFPAYTAVSQARPIGRATAAQAAQPAQGLPAQEMAALSPHTHTAQMPDWRVDVEGSGHTVRLEESSLADLAASLKYLPGAAVTGGAASMANVVFGVSIIGLLAFQATRSTVAKCLPPRKLELVPSPLLEEPSQGRDSDDSDNKTECTKAQTA